MSASLALGPSDRVFLPEAQPLRLLTVLRVVEMRQMCGQIIELLVMKEAKNAVA